MKRLASRVLVISAVIFAGAGALSLCHCAVLMPGDSFKGPLPVLMLDQGGTAVQLRADVQVLAGRIGERNVAHPGQLAAAEDYLAASLGKAGYQVQWQTFDVKGVKCSNLIAELKGTTRPDEITVVGGHYDAVANCPAANDNGSGSAATLALARSFAGHPQERTIRFVFFV